MISETKIQNELKVLQTKQEEMQQALDEKRASKTIPCANCGKRTKIKDIDLLAVMYYVRPYGCTGGDYWSFSEYNYNCTKCGMRNRFLYDSYYKLKYEDRKYHSAEIYFFDAYKHLFKSKERVYPKEKSVFEKRDPFVNNYYIDHNLSKFLPKERVNELTSHYEDEYLEITKKLKV